MLHMIQFNVIFQLALFGVISVWRYYIVALPNLFVENMQYSKYLVMVGKYFIIWTDFFLIDQINRKVL